MVEEQEEAEDSMETGAKDGQKVGWEEECGTGKEVCCMLGNSRNENPWVVGNSFPKKIWMAGTRHEWREMNFAQVGQK
jgi:hypothetical protein